MASAGVSVERQKRWKLLTASAVGFAVGAALATATVVFTSAVASGDSCDMASAACAATCWAVALQGSVTLLQLEPNTK